MTFHKCVLRLGALILLTFVLVAIEAREEPHKFTIDELLSNNYENKESNDLGLDPCKAGKLAFLLKLIIAELITLI